MWYAPRPTLRLTPARGEERAMILGVLLLKTLLKTGGKGRKG